MVQKRVAFAFVTPFSTFSKRLLDKASIYPAEMFAISTALKYIKGRKNDNKFVIYSDSKSALQALSNGSQDPFITTTLDILLSIHAESKKVIFC